MGKELLNTFDKALLLKDLSARLPYGVKMIDTEPYSAEHNPILTLSYISEDNCIGCRAGKGFMATSLGSIKPYLLPLSSMTEEQSKVYHELIKGMFGTSALINFEVLTDFFNSNHLDYRGLIKMGLAIDATGLNIY